MDKDMGKHFPPKDVQLETKHTKMCSRSLIIKTMQIKATIKYLFLCTRTARVEKINNVHCWLGYGATGTLINHWWKCKMDKVR